MGIDEKRRAFLQEVRRLCAEQYMLPLDGATDEQLEAAIVTGLGPGKWSALGIAGMIDIGRILVPGVSEELEP